MRKKKFAILGILLCMAVICLLAPRLWACGCGCGATVTRGEILSEFDPTIPFDIDIPRPVPPVSRLVVKKGSHILPSTSSVMPVPSSLKSIMTEPFSLSWEV